ncbi:PREDICTED: uncharacterized protein LOC109208753 [Nicotiana attenuata]|uniref:Uncharacterized protein n=1 Tax=Nicotiana attenuata TaxID=49451 RepID=A0A314KQ36_NICAT|nr:PREDICTED: uncharacterized protein LOC109208753 [Nicotiana attenuata]OIT31373.1 hypothetical protein A4A49_17511 [Nicotiana attenuata]
MGTKKMIVMLLLAFYFSCGLYLAKILPSDSKEVVAEQLNNHNVDENTEIDVNSKYGHAEAHLGGKGGNGGEESRSPSNQGSSNVIPIYAANAHHNHHRGAASCHRNHNEYLAFVAAMLFACLVLKDPVFIA